MGEVAGDSGTAGAAVASGAAVAAGLAAGAAVSVFCSQAASKAALARMQMYFFIISVVEKPIYAVNPESRQAAFSVLLAQKGGWYFIPCASATAGQVSRPSRVLMPPVSAGFFWQAFSKPQSANNWM